jgi:hypothetical protein
MKKFFNTIWTILESIGEARSKAIEARKQYYNY